MGHYDDHDLPPEGGYPRRRRRRRREWHPPPPRGDDLSLLAPMLFGILLVSVLLYLAASGLEMVGEGIAWVWRWLWE